MQSIQNNSLPTKLFNLSLFNLSLLFLLVTLFSCGTSTESTVTPTNLDLTVTATQTDGNALTTNVPLNPSIKLSFSQDIALTDVSNKITLTNKTTNQTIPVNVTSVDSKTLNVQLNNAVLVLNTNYALNVLKGIIITVGTNKYELKTDQEFSFTTVSTVTPTNLDLTVTATQTDGNALTTNVPLNPSIKLSFSQDIALTDVSNKITLTNITTNQTILVNVTSVDSKTLNVQLNNAVLERNTNYALNVLKGIIIAVGTNNYELKTDQEFSFTTVASSSLKDLEVTYAGTVIPKNNNAFIVTIPSNSDLSNVSLTLKVSPDARIRENTNDTFLTLTNQSVTQAFDFSTSLTLRVTVFAQDDSNQLYSISVEVAQPKAITVTYVPGTDAALEGSNVINLQSGNTVSEPNAVRQGYLLEGWYTEDTFTNQFDFATVLNDSITLYAKWRVQQKFNVMFDTNGGSAIANIEVSENTKVSKPTDPTKDNFVFGEWYKDSSLSTQYVFANEQVNSDITLYAKWKVQVTYNSNGKTNVAIPVQVINIGDRIRTQSDPVASGFTFGGWYKDSQLSKQMDFDETINQNIVLYAKWINNIKKVTFDWGIENVDNIVVDVNDGGFAQAPTNIPTRTNYIFKGWEYNGNEIDISRFKINFDLTYTANWEEIKYSVTFDASAYSTGTIEAQSIGKGKMASVPTKVIVIDKTFTNSQHYFINFEKWNLGSLEGPLYDFSTPIEGDIILYPRLFPKVYRISYKISARLSTQTISTTYGTKAVRPADPAFPSQPSTNVFIGWFKDDKFTQPFDFDTDDALLTSDITIYPQWGIVLTFDTVGGDPIDPKTYPYNSLVGDIDIPTPTRAGYIFDGWYTNASYSSVLSNDRNLPSSRTIYAKWRN